MFSNLFLNSIKRLTRQKETLMWLLAFPLLLATMFYFVMSDISTVEVVKKGSVAVVSDGSNEYFLSALESVSDYDGNESEGDLFTALKFDSAEDARQALAKGEVISALVIADEKITMLAGASDISSSMLQAFTESYLANESTIKQCVLANGGDYSVVAGVMEDLMQSSAGIENRPISKNAMNQSITWFYALLGFSCLYFMIMGKDIIVATQPYLSPSGQRAYCSPTSRIKIFFANYTSSLACSFVAILILLAYMAGMLGISFGNIFLAALAGIVGVFLAISIGMVICVLLRKVKEGFIDGIMIFATMLLSLFSGMFAPGIKNIITEHANILNFINPTSLIADCFHSLYFYDSLASYFLRLGIMFAIGVTLLVLTMLLIRRKKYAGI